MRYIVQTKLQTHNSNENIQKVEIETQKIQIVVYKSTVEKAKNFLNKLEHKQEIDPITKAKRMLYILEVLSVMK